MAGSLNQARRRWQEPEVRDASSPTRPMRVTLLTRLFTELKLRVEELQTQGEHQQVVTQRLVKLGWLVLEPTALDPASRI